jgi:ATP-binding cassette subfamily C (CFTR/MRP) protein 1
MINIPGALQAVVMGNVCASRIEQLLMQPEVVKDALSADDANSSNGIEIVNASFQWGASASNEAPTTAPADGGAAPAEVAAEAAAFTLQNVNLHARKGALTAVVGGVGSGKSSLAMACLGEMHQSSGTRRCDGPVGYVAQTAWIQNMTVRDNILFGRPFDQEKYDRVIATCSLLPDFAILPAKDATEIGEKGASATHSLLFSNVAFHCCF